MPNLGYNTIGSLGFASGVFLFASSSASRRPRLDIFFGTLFLSVSTIAYLPFAIITIPTVGVVSWYFRQSNRESQNSQWYHRIPPALPAGALAATWLFWRIGSYADVEALRRILDLNAAIGMQGGGIDKILTIFSHMWVDRTLLGAQALIFGVAAAVFRFVPNTWIAGALLLLTGPALYLASPYIFQFASILATTAYAIIVLGLATPIWVLRKRTGEWEREWAGIRGICLASIAIGFCASWASANGLRNAALGLLPSALIGIALISHPPAKEGWGPRRHPILFYAFVVSFLIFGVNDLYSNVYRDGPISTLDSTVDAGAYWGMHTTLERKEFIADFERDLAALNTDGGTILFYDYFPAGYLLTELRPRTPAVWMFMLLFENEKRHPIRDFYSLSFESVEDLPDTVVEMHKPNAMSDGLPLRNVQWDPVRIRLAQGPYEEVLHRSRYTIRKKRRPPAINDAMRGILEGDRTFKLGSGTTSGYGR